MACARVSAVVVTPLCMGSIKEPPNQGHPSGTQLVVSGICSKYNLFFTLLPKDQCFLTCSYCFYILHGIAFTAAALGKYLVISVSFL